MTAKSTQKKKADPRGVFVALGQLGGFVDEYAKKNSFLKQNGEINRPAAIRDIIRDRKRMDQMQAGAGGA